MKVARAWERQRPLDKSHDDDDVVWTMFWATWPCCLSVNQFLKVLVMILSFFVTLL